MSQTRIRVYNRINFDEKDYHKRYLGSSVYIGYKGDKMHIDGKGRERLTITALSYYHEKGDPLGRYPSRPFILQAIRGVNGVERIQTYMRRKNSSHNGLIRLVNRIVEDCKEYVKQGRVTPPLKLSTIKRKVANNDIPLVETEHLINDLQGWVVRKTR